MGAGGSDGFGEFMAGCQARMVRLADLLTRDRGRAEDLAQHGFAKAYLAWARIREGNPESYVRRCIVNAHTDWWRRRTWAERPTDDVGATLGVPDHATAVAERDVVVRALSRLTPRERAVVALRYYCGLSEAETAAEMQVRIGTVKSTASRALAKLRADAQLSEEVQR